MTLRGCQACQLTLRTGVFADRPKGRFSSSATLCASLTGSSLCRNWADSNSCRSIGLAPKSSMYFKLTPAMPSHA